MLVKHLLSITISLIFEGYLSCGVYQRGENLKLKEPGSSSGESEYILAKANRNTHFVHGPRAMAI